MEEILDPNPDSPTQNELDEIRSEIRRIEKKHWYGVVLICIVIALIIISVLISFAVIGIIFPLLLVNTLLVVIHAIPLKLANSDKLLAYSGGLIIFFITLILNSFLTDEFLLKNLFLTLAIIGSYTIVIYEEVKLKKLRSKITNTI